MYPSRLKYECSCSHFLSYPYWITRREMISNMVNWFLCFLSLFQFPSGEMETEDVRKKRFNCLQVKSVLWSKVKHLFVKTNPVSFFTHFVMSERFWTRKQNCFPIICHLRVSFSSGTRLVIVWILQNLSPTCGIHLNRLVKLSFPGVTKPISEQSGSSKN